MFEEMIRLNNYNNEIKDVETQGSVTSVYVPSAATATDVFELCGPQAVEMYVFEVFNRAILGHLAKISADYVEQLPDSDPVGGTQMLGEELEKLADWAKQFHIFVVDNRSMLEPGGH